ncbi:DUF2827 family protein [Paraburkholderia humisilvae]|uniref:DUF2827 domain-containing protein n=1 Tax=Paraburkholderia humisilvae TaxID=627669 RepID=A0A6J5F6P5_9BURK|nr:DUF2827 family protein [Paraburkholderia humisilvae]CAB3773252.1 hypothetical protein LMG29542_07162 [Paraburkholderia humisilvae]
MRIGISVLTHAGQNIWENGLGQNVLFLADLLTDVEFVQSVILINCGDQEQLPPQVDARARALPLVKPCEAGDLVDVIIEMSGGLDVAWLDLMRARGKRVIFNCCGQPYVNLIEPIIFNRAPYAARYERCDEVWYLSKDTQHAPLLRMLFRCDAFEVPFLWDARFVTTRAQEIAPLGFKFGFQAPHGAGLRVAIFEPNVSVVKASSIPMLICEEAYRTDSRTVPAMHVLNTLHMTEHQTLLHLANSLDIVRQQRATFHGRHDVVGFMAQHGDAVVSHQWANEQNYNHLDVLHGDYPLIHNARWLRDAGYYYPDFDIAAGGQALVRAVGEHHKGLESYRGRTRDVYAKVSPAARVNREAYARRLWRLVRGRVSGGVGV